MFCVLSEVDVVRQPQLAPLRTRWKIPVPGASERPFAGGALWTADTCSKAEVGEPGEGARTGSPGTDSLGAGEGRGRQSKLAKGSPQPLLFRVSVRPKLTVTIDTNVNSTVLTLEDNVQSWQPGDTLVVASTDYSMYQAEEFQVLPCKACASNQVRVAGRTSTKPVPGWRDASC